MKKKVCATFISNLVSGLIKTNFRNQAQEDAQDSLQLKLSLETEKRELEEQASKAESDLDKQVRMVGNYVHDSVPIGTDEVSDHSVDAGIALLNCFILRP